MIKKLEKFQHYWNHVADGTGNNINLEETSGGKRYQEKLSTGSGSRKGKKTEQKNKKSIGVPNDDTEQTDAENNRCQTHSTTIRTKILTMPANLTVIEPSQMKIQRKAQMKIPMMSRITCNRN